MPMAWSRGSHVWPTAMAEEFLALFTTHAQAHPVLRPQDAYKFLYQRVFGPEHSVENLAAARERLYLEVLHLPAQAPTVPPLEPLSPMVCRVNLWPLVRTGGNIAALWQAFKQTLRDFQPGTLDDLQRLWRLLLTTAWARGVAAGSLEQFWQQMATEGFPPVHHSRAYATAYAPHYRVVLCALAERLHASS